MASQVKNHLIPNLIDADFFKIGKKCRNIQRVPFMFGNRFKSSDIACSATSERFFWTSAFSSVRCNLLRIKRQKFGYSVLGQMGALVLNICLLFHILFRGTQFTLDITSKLRIILKKSLAYICSKTSIWDEQAGNGISRRHIYGSKIAKGHESVKKLQVSNSQKEYQTHKKPKRRKWRAKKGIISHFLTSI